MMRVRPTALLLFCSRWCPVARSVWDSLVGSVTRGLGEHEDVVISRVLWDQFPSIAGSRSGQRSQRLPRDEFSSLWDDVTPHQVLRSSSACSSGIHGAFAYQRDAVGPGAGSRPRNVFAKTHAAVQESTQSTRQDTSEVSQASKKVIKIHGGVVTFLPQRLLNQHLDLNSTKMLNLLSTRGYQARVNLAGSLDTGAYIMNEIKNAFKQQKKSLDLTNVETEFACFMNTKAKTWLTELPVALHKINRVEFEEYYASAPCVIVPTVDPEQPDHDFIQFKMTKADDVKPHRGKSRQATVAEYDEFADADDSDLDNSFTAARPKPVPMTSEARRKLRRRCRSCYEKLSVDSDCDIKEVRCAQKEHWAVCKKPDREEVQWYTDSDEPERSPIPNVCVNDNFERNVAGIPADIKARLINRMRKYPEVIRLDLEDSDEDGEDAATDAGPSAIKLEAEEEAASCACDKPDSADHVSGPVNLTFWGAYQH
ncbi:hypothetical protein V8E36_002789 [Tilletia maclaganii]